MRGVASVKSPWFLALVAAILGLVAITCFSGCGGSSDFGGGHRYITVDDYTDLNNIPVGAGLSINVADRWVAEHWDVNLDLDGDGIDVGSWRVPLGGEGGELLCQNLGRATISVAVRGGPTGNTIEHDSITFRVVPYQPNNSTVSMVKTIDALLNTAL